MSSFAPFKLRIGQESLEIALEMLGDEISLISRFAQAFRTTSKRVLPGIPEKPHIFVAYSVFWPFEPLFSAKYLDLQGCVSLLLPSSLKRVPQKFAESILTTKFDEIGTNLNLHGHILGSGVTILGYPTAMSVTQKKIRCCTNHHVPWSKVVKPCGIVMGIRS